jgi:hypothetical protein
MAIATINDDADLSKPDWDALIPRIFDDPLFKPAGRRRKLACVNGLWVGVVIAWQPSGYVNFGLNKEDIDRLFEKRGDGSLDVGFVVLATIENGKAVYVAHREAEAVRERLKDVPQRDGPYGPYWLIRSFSSSTVSRK